MEQISDKPTERNFEYMYQLKKNYPDKVMVSSIMGCNVEEWRSWPSGATRSAPT